MWYCDVAPGHEFHGPYHDTEYGFPTDDETVLFERLAMEIMQAGLSWLLVLKKRQNLNEAFAKFDVDRVAAFGESEIDVLLENDKIIRNRRKIMAIIENAAILQSMRASHGGFADWIAAHHPLSKLDWIRLFKKTFKFTGGEITGEFLMSTGYLPGAHRHDCPVFQNISRSRPPWIEVSDANQDDR